MVLAGVGWLSCGVESVAAVIVVAADGSWHYQLAPVETTSDDGLGTHDSTSSECSDDDSTSSETWVFSKHLASKEQREQQEDKTKEEEDKTEEEKEKEELEKKLEQIQGSSSDTTASRFESYQGSYQPSEGEALK